MKKTIAGLLPLLAVAALQSAGAQTILSTGGSACGGDNYLGCFNATLSFSASTFTLEITNTGAGAFTQIGIGGLSTAGSPSFTYTPGAVSIVGSPGATFGAVRTNPNGLSGAGIDRPIIGIDAGGNNGLVAGGTATFSFAITGGTFDASGVQIAVHQQGGAPNAICGGSTKIVLTRGGAATTSGTANQPANPLCWDVPGGGGQGSVVPEPATYALMGTGLLGLGLVGTLRSRRTREG